MGQDAPLLSALVFLGAAAAMLAAMLALSAWLGPRRRHPVKDQPFECGVPDVAPLPDRFPVRFYVVGLLFLVFDVEIAFFFPWAVILRETGRTAFYAMAVFAGVLACGLAYAWKRGALKWD